MGLKTWAREELFRRVADALQHPSPGGSSFWGWSMDRWIKFLKMLGFAVAGAVASGVGNAIQAGQVHSVTDLKGAALGAGVAAAVAYLKLPHGAVDPAKDDAAK